MAHELSEVAGRNGPYVPASLLLNRRWVSGVAGSATLTRSRTSGT